LYYASVLSHPTGNSLADLTIEAFQGFQAMQGDPPGGSAAQYIIKFDNQGVLIFTDFAKFITRVRDYFNPGDNI